MVEFTAKDVMALRERTGAGMMDCKKALTEAAGDADRAVDILREKGLAAAAMCTFGRKGFAQPNHSRSVPSCRRVS